MAKARKKEPPIYQQSFLTDILPKTKELPVERRRCEGFAIPGLDADLCRCPSCIDQAEGGVWWFSAEMRDPKKKRERIGSFDGMGDVAIEDQGGKDDQS
jgi:hypothetical protein